MPVSAVFENLEAGATLDEIIEQFDITRDQINAVLEFAARSLDRLPPQSPPWMLILFDHVTPGGIAIEDGIRSPTATCCPRRSGPVSTCFLPTKTSSAVAFQ